ncbi:MAG TPA: hypothetical protein VF043_27890 [Ktedonobacteraceae bacterium]
MYYRIAIQQGRGHLDRPATWQWKSTPLSSLQSLFQVLRLYGALPQEHLRVFSSPSREGLEEQLGQENSGCGSASVTAAHFLQQRLIHSSAVTSAGGARGYEGTASIAVSTTTREDESVTAAHILREKSRSALEGRRLEHELGTGGDHDLPYHFALPLSLPQVLAWLRLMGRVQRGELQP